MSGTAKRLAEAANHIINPQPIAEAFKDGDKVKVPHKGKMVSGKIIRYDDGGTDKARQSGGGYVVDVGEPASIFVPKEKVQKEAVVTEISKATKDAYVVKRGSQLQRMTTGLDKDRNLLTGRQQANAVKGIKRATGVKEEAEQIDELSKKTLGSYVKKAASNIGRRSADAETHDASMGAPGTSESELAKERKKIKQRYKGIGQAVKRLTKEEAEQIDELTKMRRLGQTVGAILSKNPGASTPAERLKTAQSIRANKQYWTPERIAKQDEIDAKIRKMDAADAVEEIKEIINSYDKQTKAMIIAGMKSIKESAEITEAPYTPANDYEGEMAMTQLKSIMEKASDVLGMMKPEAKMEAWVQSKITLADEHISCVRDYLKHTDGAVG